MCSGEGGCGILIQKTFPYVSGIPLLGNLSDITRDRLGFLQRMARVGDVCGLRFGPFPGMFFNKPEHVQSILVEHACDFDKGIALRRRHLPPMILNGIVCSEGEQHRCQRKLMAPAFQPRHIASYADTIGDYGERLQQTWPAGGVIDIHQQMTSLTMSIIGKVLFDADMFTETDELGAAIMVTFEYLSYVTSMFFPLPYSWPTARNRRMRQALQILRTRMQRFIDERRNDAGQRNDFLSILLHTRDEHGASMSDDQLMTECLNLFGAGYETTATALSWAWMLLCQHPETYQRVRQEVDGVLQGRTPTCDDLEHLPYCLQVLKEALRLYPPVYFTGRRALRDVEIDGYHVPKDCFVMLAPYTLHRREEYFPQPETFDPERFAPEEEKQRPRYAYVPFGAGPRICLGLHFALMEGHLLLATIAQRTSFSLLPKQVIEINPKHNLLLRPVGPLSLRVEKRSAFLNSQQYAQPLQGSNLRCPHAEVG